MGDRGILKGPQIAALPDDFRYVTAISKPQIRKKLNDKIFQYELFTEKVSEVEENGSLQIYALQLGWIHRGVRATGITR